MNTVPCPIDVNKISDLDFRPLARHIVEMALAFYEDPKNCKEYEEWEKERVERGEELSNNR